MMNPDKAHEQVLLITNDQIIPANRFLLVAGSHYFRLALDELHGDHLVVPPVVPSESLRLLVSALQSPDGFGSVLNHSNAYHLLVCSQIMQMPTLVAQCRTFLAMSCFNMMPSSSSLRLDETSNNRNHIWRPFRASNSNSLTHPIDHLNFFTRAKRRPVVVLTDERKTSPVDVENFETEEDSIDLTPKKHLRKPQVHENHLEVAACDGPVFFKKITNPMLDQLISDPACWNENDKKKSGRTFKCLFCSQSFKSKYCFQKHKRRHLNPMILDPDDVSEGNDIVLKDINVQFFPCKICGAKFPSYYFVHKHKRLWHADEIETGNGSITGSEK